MSETFLMAGPRLADRLWQLFYLVAFRLALSWWWLRRPSHEGALVAIWLQGRILLVRQSYRREWSLPGGGVKRAEAPGEAASRELAEEIGLAVEPEGLRLARNIAGFWDFRRDNVSVFELDLDQPPPLRLDQREILEARFLDPATAMALLLTPVARDYITAAARGARSR